ncbi:hypothetical protein [Microbacterium hominis]|uniref:hypothetical protein n=1 Tax=Microbacterium hominis TaxID=162426 RepID=UPI0007687424|nr:hypothetical protein [Microbacterium hominis]KXC05771.1 hypothetical protein MhomT_09220 [Microbacterium hominis]
MTDAPNVATYNKSGTIKIGADNYTKGVDSFALVPTTPTAQHTDIGGGVQSVVGIPTWVCQMSFAQDWASEGSLSQKSIEWAGQTKTIEFTPQTGAEVVTVEVVFQPSQIGGAAGGINKATLNLGVNGQPDFGA